MSKNIQKSIQKYISKIKKQAPHLQISHSSLSSTTSKILKGCKHPKSLSFALDYNHKSFKDRRDKHHQSDEAATLEDIDKFLVENFKSLYGDHDEKKEKEKSTQDNRSGSESSDVVYDDSPRIFTPNLNSLRGSPLYSTSPTSSGSLPEEVGISRFGNPPSPTPYDIKDDKSPISEGIEDCIAVLTVSSSPYEDFRRSMEGVLYARTHNNQSVDWDFMEELLFCYLRVNAKKQHKFILSAFVDLIAVLQQNSSPKESCGSDGDNGHLKGKKRRD
ncbi:hypothetical protein RND81_14G168500 [Saponaria officinalis]|uniref:Transcription repressor n=1 Tax=Saponaria officinalis TaxID=3572 RepID=A0AAW1GQT5_SAPOF